MIFLQLLASSEQVFRHVWCQRGSVAAIRHPPVAHEHTGEVGPDNRGGIVEPAAGTNGETVVGVTQAHSQWLRAPTRHPVSSGVTTAALRTCSHSAV